MRSAFPWPAIPLLIGAVACARYDSQSKETAVPGKPGSIESTTFAPALGVDLKAMTKTPSGLYYRDLVVGTGEPVVAGKEVSVHYSGSFPDGRVFDANQGSDPPFAFVPGAGGVIGGWEEGVVGMRVGGKRQLIVPPELGYGASDYGPIPGGSILFFTVEAVAIR